MVSHFKVQGDHLTKADLRKGKKKNRNVRTQYINFAEDDQMEIQGFVFSELKSRLCCFFHLVTFGILRLIFHWYPFMHLQSTHRKCDLKIAEKVLIKDDYNGKTSTYFVKKIIILSSEGVEQPLTYRLSNGETKESHQIRIIKCKKLTYVWDEDKETFIKLAGLENGISRLRLHDFKGLSEEQQARQRTVYGNNEIQTPEQTIMTLLILEALTPFYIFQLFSLLVWCAELYIYYGIAIIIMSVVGISTSIIQTRKNQRNLKGTIGSFSVVTICRGNGVFENVSTKYLVPGDVIVLPPQGCEMYCDAVLLSGSCIVNESMLTGESVPVTKTPLEHHNTSFSLKEDINHTIFCGTKIIQAKTHSDQKIFAVVIRTGFLTSKGELVRSILYPPPADFKFDRDSYKYMGILAIIALLGTVYTIVSKMSRSIRADDILLKALDIFTIVIPPALPAAMTVGKLFAVSRLKSNRIYCINTRVINVSGSVNCVCFDKTGTLTEDALDMLGAISICEGKIDENLKNVQDLSRSELFFGMATCHSLNSIEGEVVGDPLDIKMFEATKWILVDNHIHGKTYGQYTPAIIVKSSDSCQELGILKQYHFSSSLQRMSVIIKSPNQDQLKVFCKGSPEKVISLSKTKSVPRDIFQRLKKYTSQGYRVIGIACKKLEGNLEPQAVSKLHRSDVENDLEFLGLLILENRLKPQTKSVIKTLGDAKLKIVMITGDNIQTAVTVARDCLIIDENCAILDVIVEKSTKQKFASINYHVLGEPTQLSSDNGKIPITELESGKRSNFCFVITGPYWANLVKYFPELIPKIVTKGAVFARMTGSQKQQVIEELKNLGYYVAMCGDGANDCGALKAAHVGISLSEAESSVASPFTSKETNISCVPKVITQGRAALVTSFGVFMIMMCYSLTEFASVIILYSIDTNLGSIQFLFIDICLVLNFAALFGRTKACDKLAKTRPRTSLLSILPLCSIGTFIALATGSQLFAYHYIQTYEWFEPYLYGNCEASIISFCPSYENFAVFTTSLFGYITMFIIFAKGKPYRKNIFTNTCFIMSLIATTILCIYITLNPAGWIIQIIELKPPPMEGRLMCIWIAIAMFIISYGVQCFIIELVIEKWAASVFHKYNRNKKQYLKVLKAMEKEPSWPPSRVEDMTIQVCNELGKNGIQNEGFSNSE